MSSHVFIHGQWTFALSTFSESLQLLQASSAIHELQIYAAITALYTPELQRTFRIVSVTPVSPVPAYKSDIFILVLLWDCHVNHESSLLYCSELYPASSGFLATGLYGTISASLSTPFNRVINSFIPAFRKSTHHCSSPWTGPVSSNIRYTRIDKLALLIWFSELAKLVANIN